MVSGEFSENAFRKDFIISEMAEIKRALEPEIKREAEIRMKAGRLRQVPEENIRWYQIMSPELVSDVIYKYKKSFVDRVVNNYTEMVEEL